MQIIRDGVFVNTINYPIASGRTLITGLDPTTSYTFQARVSNSLGKSEVISSSLITTVGRSHTYCIHVACVSIIVQTAETTCSFITYIIVYIYGAEYGEKYHFMARVQICRS